MILGENTTGQIFLLAMDIKNLIPDNHAVFLWKNKNVQQFHFQAI